MKIRILLACLSLIVALFVPATAVLAQGSEDPNVEEKKADEVKSTEPEEPALYKVKTPGLKFREIGPALTSGRISDFAVNPDDPSEYYVGVASGGVWKTTNRGITFKPIFDREGSYSIGCVTMDPNNHHVIWVGTGENNNQRSVAYGDGVYRSLDGGKSWKNMGLKESEHIGMIAVDPRDSNIVFVAAYGPLWSAGGDRGLYRSTDGGENWEAVLTVSEHTGVSEVHMDPREPDVMYAVAHQRRRHVFTFIDGGPESALYKSTDGGSNWRKIKRGFPEGHLGRIGLAVSPVNPDVVYAIVEAQADKGGFYRSSDRGETWERRSDYSSSGNYYQEIIADPEDVDRVYSMDTYGQVTLDGGKTWSRTGEKNKHVDNHALWIDPDNPRYLLNGNDGGIYESYDRGATWRFMTNLPITQFYRVAVDNAEPFYGVYGGTQDNYSLGGPSRTTSPNGIANEDWFVTQGGDGFESQIDPLDPNIVYAQSQYGNLSRFDRKSGERIGIKPREKAGENAYNWNWDAPLLISPHLNTRLYFAADLVFRSDDRGDSWEAVSGDLSRQLDRNKLEVMGQVWPMDAVAKHRSTSKYGAVVALEESTLSEGLLYAGTDDGLIHVTEDGGSNWTRHESFPGVPEMTYVNAIIPSQHDRNTVYAAFNNHKRGDFKPYVLKSTDLGQTWSSIAANLPERGSVYTIAEDHVKPGLLFVGTEFGVHYTLDGGQHWKKLGRGLPTIAVRDMAIQRRENDLVLATFGRGFYVLDDYAPLRDLSEDVIEADGHMFTVSDGRMFLPYSRIGGRDKGFQGETFYTAPNPDVGAKITYYYKETVKTAKETREAEEAKRFKKKEPVDYPSYEELRAEEDAEEAFLLVTILDQQDAVVRNIRRPAREGIQRVNWDLRFPNITSASSRGGGRRRGGGSGILVLPGTYKVALSQSIDGEITRLTEPVSFEVTTLDNRSLPATDRGALVEFQAKLAKLNQALTGARQATENLGERIRLYDGALKAVLAPSADVHRQVRDLESAVDDARRSLFGDRTLQQLDRDQPPSIANRVSSIVFSGFGSTSDPTETQRLVYALIEEEFDPVIERINRLVTVDAPAIETRLDELGAPWTPGRKVQWQK